MNEMPLQHKPIYIETLFHTGDLEIRPLTTIELQQSMLMARDSGFYGNGDLLKYIIDCAVLNEGDPIDIETLDFFFKLTVAREVWIVTLKSIESKVNRLKAFVDLEVWEKFIPGKIRRYKFSELATPGLLWTIQKDIKKINVENYVNEIIRLMVPNVGLKGKTLKGKQKERFIEERKEIICQMLLEKNFVDTSLDKILPHTLFTTAERFYISLQLAETLDWNQYLKVIFNFNICVENLNLQSNRLGGVDTDKGILISGIPGFIEIFRYPKSAPILVVASLLKDLFYKNKISISRHYRRILNELYKEIMNDCVNRQKESKQNKEDLFFEILNTFGRKINLNQRLLNQICYCYWEELTNSVNDYVKENSEKFIKEYSVNKIPDCYLLVEGVSEEICFRKFVHITKNSEVFIKVIDCKSKSGVYTKYRDVIKNDSYIGAIVTVLDSDAEQEHHMIKKINPKYAVAEHYIYDFGEFEDLFPVNLHVYAVNSLFSQKYSVGANDFNSEQSIVPQLKKIIWEKYKSEFDKKTYSLALAKSIEDPDDIPPLAMSIVAKSIELAEKQRKLFNKPTIHSLDRRNRQLENLAESLLGE